MDHSLAQIYWGLWCGLLEFQLPIWLLPKSSSSCYHGCFLSRSFWQANMPSPKNFRAENSRHLFWFMGSKMDRRADEFIKGSDLSRLSNNTRRSWLTFLTRLLAWRTIASAAEMCCNTRFGFICSSREFSIAWPPLGNFTVLVSLNKFHVASCIIWKPLSYNNTESTESYIAILSGRNC